MFKVLVITLLLISCGKAEKPAVPKADSRIELLRQKHNQMLVKASLSFDGETQWPSMNDCDGLLWAGLARAVGIDVDLSVAELKPGIMHRRPHKPCWVDGVDYGSASTISNDMLLGYMFGLWRSGDLESLKRLADYGESNSFIMGQPFPEMASRVLLKPNQISLLGKLMHKLSGGEIDQGYRFVPMIYFPVGEDYERHLQAVSLLMLSELQGLTKSEISLLDSLIKADKSNPFFLGIKGIYSGDFEDAIGFLLDDRSDVPTYVRGHENYKLVHWLVSSDVVLRQYREGNR